MTFAKRWLFAFTIVFFFLPNCDFPWAFIPPLAPVAGWIEKSWDLLVLPVAHHVFHIAVDGAPNGSGDTSYYYVLYAIWLLIALIAATVWAAVDRDGAHYERIFGWFRVFLRLALAAALISYGVAKILPAQFPAPFLDRLVQPFGTASPMGLLWTFMGTSRAYNIISGGAEVLSAILLTMRRTSLAGAIVGMVVLANIVALNFCYDVPVKLYSIQLFLEAFIIAAPDLPRLAAIVFAADGGPRRTLWVVLRTAAVVAYVWYQFHGVSTRTQMFTARSPLRGIWNIDELTENGVARPPLISDLTRWRRIIFDVPRFVSVHLMSDTRVRYMADLNEKQHTLKMTDRDNPKSIFTLAYARPDGRTLVLDGVVDGRRMHAVCHLSSLTTGSLLLTRGFHWINESPFNR